MSVEMPPDNHALRVAFEHDIYSSSGKPLKFGSLFYDCDVYPAEKRILVIFIRHFFCGNCQEYVRRLSSAQSPFHPSLKPTSTTWTTNFSKPANRTLPSVIIIGPGQPSLISSYKSLTQCPFDIYADPSTQLYDILGMHRTLSMGTKAPGYIEHSLLGGAVKSAWQIVRRFGSGDALAGGDWDVNGGEFLFTRPATGSRSESHSPSRSRSRSRSANSRVSSNLNWTLTWCHRMLNSRDHTELIDLAYHTCFSIQSSLENSTRTQSPAPPLKSILVSGNKTHTKTLSHSYSSERLGACPAPNIPKSKAEALASPHHNRPGSRSKARPRSRSTSVSSGQTAKQNHDRIWSSMSSSDTLCSESRASTTTDRENLAVSPISEAEEEEIKPRKSFSASVAEAFGIRTTLLKRSKSVSGSSPAPEGAPTLPRPSTSFSGLRPASRASSNKTKARSKSIIDPIPLLRPKPRAGNHSKAAASQEPTTSPSRPRSPSATGTHTRTRTFSFSKTASKHRPSLSLTRKPSSRVGMDENGVMLVNGVEFVNVISVKARIESSDEDEQSRKRLRDRADSGLGMDVSRNQNTTAVGTRALKELPPLPLVAGHRKNDSAVPALS
ncbi:hypothetical protein G647_03401 [Cladophialophora carrionii CBS 160.54]|uniref:Uncharacterized protein n=1 Tax=Cladophialophora carrionii CBS 160.54 TaxID=1279043 RepID=V9DDJ0_9EURO|nr:uncharacterized protein G647_03401 [Cladophialophora carrionii CBS 160.54]ETI24032.1 hypothetical protein G647_03401 [Cladophialophora carrionii CBS 160.54]